MIALTRHVLTPASRRPLASIAQMTRSSEPFSRKFASGRRRANSIRSVGSDSTLSAHAVSIWIRDAPASSLQSEGVKRAARAILRRILLNLQQAIG